MAGKGREGVHRGAASVEVLRVRGRDEIRNEGGRHLEKSVPVDSNEERAARERGEGVDAQPLGGVVCEESLAELGGGGRKGGEDFGGGDEDALSLQAAPLYICGGKMGTGGRW